MTINLSYVHVARMKDERQNNIAKKWRLPLKYSGNPWNIDCGDTTWLIHAQALGADRNRQELNQSHIPTLLLQPGTTWHYSAPVFSVALATAHSRCWGQDTDPLRYKAPGTAS